MGFRKKLVRGSSLILVSSVALVLLGIGKSVVVARLLDDPDLLGLLGILASIAAIFVSVGTIGLPTALTRYFAQVTAEGQEHSIRLIQTGFSVAVMLAVASGVGMFASSWFLAVTLYHRSDLVPLLQVGALYVAVSSLSAVVAGALRGLQRMKALAVLNLVHGATSIVASFVLIIWFGVLGGAIAILTSSVATALVATTWLRNGRIGKFNWLRSPDRASLREVGTYAMPLFVSEFILFPAVLASESILAIAAGFDDLGMYRLGRGIHNLITAIPGVLAIPLMPMIAELSMSSPKRANNIVAQILKVTLLVVTPISVGIAFASELLLRILYGETYVGAAEISSLLVLAALFASLSLVARSLLQASGKTSIILFSDTLWASVLVLASFTFVGGMGLAGIGYAYLLASSAALGVTVVYLRRTMTLRLDSLLPALALAVLAVVGSIWVLSVVPNEILLLVALPVALGLTGLGFLLLKPEERTLLRKSLRDVTPWGLR